MPHVLSPVYGHLDLIGRGARIFDELIVSVAAVSPKSHLFSVDERVTMVKELVKHLGCGHSGYSEEFVEGIQYRCPSCGAQARIGDPAEADGEQFKVSDSLYECEDCGAVSAKALMSFNCIKCKARLTR